MERVLVYLAQADEPTHSIRVRSRTPGNLYGEAVSFSLTSTVGVDQTGTRSYGTDSSGLMSCDLRFDSETQSGSGQFKLGDFRGVEIGEAFPAILLAASMVFPNVLQVAGKYGPFHDFQAVPASTRLIDPTEFSYLRALSIIQSRIATAIRIPDLDTVTAEEAREILNLATMLEGQVLVATWEPIDLDPEIADRLDVDGKYQFALEYTKDVSIGDQEVTVTETTRSILLSAKVEAIEGRVRAVPYLNDTCHVMIFHSPTPLPSEGIHFLAKKLTD